jgi:NAD(P)-dependent dehydrogenase (short-subunit alcohol dehydrogenase family)
MGTVTHSCGLPKGHRRTLSSRKADACAAAERELTPYGKIVAIPADLSAEAECLRLASEIGQREPALNVLVNNAGCHLGRADRGLPRHCLGQGRGP